MKILFLSHHWTNNSHHSQYSGFQRLVVFAAKENKVTLVTWGQEESEYTDEQGIRVITVKGAKKDLLFLKRMRISLKGRQISDNYDAIHALYSDCTFFLKRNSFTVTFHVLPGIAFYPEWKQRIFLFLKYNLLQKRAMRRSKHIVCVSRNLLERIPEKHQAKALFIPHGIDTDFWNPALAVAPDPISPAAPDPLQKSASARTALCVGSHGLNRELLQSLIRANPDTRFVMVGVRNNLEGCPEVEYRSGISDEELRNLYASADIMIRPLVFSTANNSILEAMAMGKTILASKIPGITDYLEETNCIFLDPAKGLSLEKLVPGKLDPGVVRGSAVRNFSWGRVLKAYGILYENKTPQPQTK